MKRHFEKQLNLKDTQDIERLARTATRRFPRHHEAWLLRAASHRLNGQLDEAQVAIQKSLLIQDSVEALLELLQLELALDNEEAVLQIARHIASHYPEFKDQLPAELRERAGDVPGIILFSPEIKNFMPIGRQKTNRLKPDDVCLVSYPHSGAGRMRSFIASILLHHKGLTTHTDPLPLPIHDIIPDLHLNDVSNTWTYENGFSFRLFKSYDLAGVAKQPLLYVFRHPIETLRSCYQYHLRKPLLRQNMNVSCNTFCLSKMDEYRAHLATAVQLKKAMPDNVMFISYKSLQKAPIDSLGRVMPFIGLDIDKATLQLAIANCEYEFELQYSSTSDAALLDDTEETRLNPDTKTLLEEALMQIYQEALNLEELSEQLV